jgi:peptidoglycan/xylan/chitin deacetylase (PgdA/CDA1 family)
VFLAVLVVGGLGAFAFARAQSSAGRVRPSSAASVQSSSSAERASAASVPTTPAAATPAPVQEPTPPVVTPPGTSDKSAAAVAKAAVDFPGAPSVKPVSLGQLKPKHKYIAITIDDGYGFQPEMLALLQKYDARCTTFVLGGWAASNTSTLKKLDAAGFEIANHTWDHKTLTKLSEEQQRSELLRTQKVISAVTGNQAPYMRPPGGATNARVKSVAADLGYQQVMWTRTFADSSKHASADNSYHWVMEYGGGVRPGDIILCHWGSKNTLAAMRRILPELKAQGYEFVTVSELIADSANTKK